MSYPTKILEIEYMIEIISEIIKKYSKFLLTYKRFLNIMLTLLPSFLSFFFYLSFFYFFKSLEKDF